MSGRITNIIKKISAAMLAVALCMTIGSLPGTALTVYAADDVVTVSLQHAWDNTDKAVIDGYATIVTYETEPVPGGEEPVPHFTQYPVSGEAEIDPETRTCYIENDTEPQFTVKVDLTFDESTNRLSIQNVSLSYKADDVDVASVRKDASYIQYYAVTVEDYYKHGKVVIVKSDGTETNKVIASKDQDVTLKAIPDERCVLDDIFGVDNNGNREIIEHSDGNVYFFYMPERDLTIKANFNVADEAAVAQIAETGEKFFTLDAARDTAQTGQTVKMLKNIDLGGSAFSVGDRTFGLDLNGFTLSGSTNFALITNFGNGTLTILDSSEEKSGTVDADSIVAICLRGSGSAVDIRGGTVQGKSYSVWTDNLD